LLVQKATRLRHCGRGFGSRFDYNFNAGRVQVDERQVTKRR
jgi:hypothetical protein